MPGGQGAGDRREGGAGEEAAAGLNGAHGSGDRREEEEGVGTEVAVVLSGAQGAGDYERMKKALGQSSGNKRGKGGVRLLRLRQQELPAVQPWAL